MVYVLPTGTLERAFELVQNTGPKPMRALAAGATGRMDGNDILVVVASAYQNSDGGWHGFDSDMEASLSTLSQTHLGLQSLRWIEPSGGSSLDLSIEFLRRSQRDTGCWDEPEEILMHNPPPWILPGDRDNQLWLTSAVCCKLLEHRREADVRFESALAFLRAGWDGERFPKYTQPHWMALLLFSRLSQPSQADRRIAEGCEQFLAKALTGTALDPMDVTDIAYAAFRAGAFARRLFGTAFEKVLDNQADDGGWVTNYGDRHRVWATVEAMFLLRTVSESTPTC